MFKVSDTVTDSKNTLHSCHIVFHADCFTQRLSFTLYSVIFNHKSKDFRTFAPISTKNTAINRQYMTQYSSIFRYLMIGILLLGTHLLANAQAGKSGKGGNAKPNSTLKDTIIKNIAINDTLPKDSTRLSAGDSLAISRKTAYIDSLKKVTDLKSKVTYNAEDSIVFDVVNQLLLLYGKAHIEYEDMKISAYKIVVDWKTQIITAEGKVIDAETEEIMDKPNFTQGEQSYTAKTMTYNFKTQKGRVIEARTTEGEGFLLAEKVKRLPDNSFFGLNGKYTTCNEPDHPHFYIKSRKMKVIPNSKIISGPLNLVIEDFPIPIVIPFGFIPNTKKKTSGLILPTYGEQGQRGFFLSGLGYYWGGNPYFDLLVKGDIYSKGGWGVNAQTRYKYGTRLDGGVSVSYGIIKFNEPTDPDYQKTIGWKIQANHSHRINQNTNISGNISFDKNFNRNLTMDIRNNTQNVQTSSIAFSKSKIGRIPVSLNMSGNLNQDVNRGVLNLTLPDVNINLASQTPFKNIKSTKDFWNPLKQLSTQYTFTATNRISSIPDFLLLPVLQSPNRIFHYTDVNADSVFRTVEGRAFFQNGIKHYIPISTQIKMLKYINITPNFTYNEYWYFKSQQKFFDTDSNKVVTRNVNGFKTARDFQFNLRAGTTFYALLANKASKRGMVVRHMMVPGVTYSYKPDFSDPKWNYFASYQDTLGKEIKYNRFANAGLGSPSQGESQSLNFSMHNEFEMKIRKKASFKPDFPEKEDKFEKVKLLDALDPSFSYNFAADSFQLSPINLSARTTVFNRKININSSMSMDPYAYDSVQKRRINVFEWKENQRLGRLTSAQVSVNTSFQPKKKVGIIKKSPSFNEAEYAMIRNYMDGYIDFNIPWTVNLNYNLSYNKPTQAKATVTNIFQVSGDLSLTPKWKIGYTTGYDFKSKRLVDNTSVSLHRDLHCWDMNFSWIPLGRYQSYMLTINVKSSTLQDLKLNKKNNWTDRFRQF